MLPRFRDIAGFLLRNWPHVNSTRILGVFPLNRIAEPEPESYANQPNKRVSQSVSQSVNREIIFELFQPMIAVPQRHRQTNRQYYSSSHNRALRSVEQ